MPAGHGFEDAWSGELHGGHETTIGGQSYVSVCVMALENAAEPERRSSTSPASIYSDAAEGLTGPEARQVAAALLEAAGAVTLPRRSIGGAMGFLAWAG